MACLTEFLGNPGGVGDHVSCLGALVLVALVLEQLINGHALLTEGGYLPAAARATDSQAR